MTTAADANVLTVVHLLDDLAHGAREAVDAATAVLAGPTAAVDAVVASKLAALAAQAAAAERKTAHGVCQATAAAVGAVHH